jgi:hypothetical protein
MAEEKLAYIVVLAGLMTLVNVVIVFAVARKFFRKKD